MVNKTKKGFTIVELVIVIAVIAILAAVLIPTFSNLINKANESADTQLIRNLNTALAMDGEKHETMYDALQAVENNGGFIVAKVIASVTKNEILWDSENDVFCYLKEGESKPEYIPQTKLTVENPADVAYWRISSKTEDLTGKYSVYYTGDTPESGKIITSVGFDAGKVEGITSVEYNGSDAGQTVIIRTNSYATVVTIDAEKDVVKHYDKVGTVEILAVAPSSYHEYGTVLGNLTITKGHVEIASGADVGTILVSSANAGDVAIDFVNGAKVGTVAPTTESAKTDINNSTSIPAESKQDEIVDTTELSKFAGGLGTEASPYLISTAEHFYNMHKLDFDNKAYYFEQINDLTISNSFNDALNITYNGKGYSIYLSEDVESDTGLILLFGRSKDYLEINNLNIFSNKNLAATLVGYNLSGCGYSSGCVKLDKINTYVRNNETIEVNTEANFGFLTYGAIYSDKYTENTPIDFITITNCKNYASIQTSQRVAAFLGGYDGWDDNFILKLTMKDCINYGNITCSGQEAGVISANSYGNNFNTYKGELTIQDYIIIENVINEGTITGTTASAFAIDNGVINTVYQSAIGGRYVSTTGVLADLTLSIGYNESGFIIDDNSYSVEYDYKVLFSIDSILAIGENSPFNSRTIEIESNEVENIGTKIDTKNARAYDRKTAIEQGIISSEETLVPNGTVTGVKVSIIIRNNTLYIIILEDDSYIADSRVKVYVNVYDKTGSYIATKAIVQE